MKVNTDILFDKILKTGILIGSRQWGGYTEDSDYDLVFGDKITKKLIKVFKTNNIRIKYLGNSASGARDRHTMFNILNIKVNLKGKVINILSYDDDELPKIEELNNYMNSIRNTSIGISAMENKRVRIHVVENYLQFAFDIENIANSVPESVAPKISAIADFETPLDYSSKSYNYNIPKESCWDDI